MKMCFLTFAILSLTISLTHSAKCDDGWPRHSIDSSLRGADGVRLDDFDGDGLLDVVTGWEESGVVRLYLNPGASAAKQPWPAVTVGKSPSPEDAVPFDVDGDGKLEVISCHEGKTKRVFVHRCKSSYDRAGLLRKTNWDSKPIEELDGQSWMFATPVKMGKRSAIAVASKGDAATISLAYFKNRKWDITKIRDAGWIMTLKAKDMDGDGDDDILYSDRKGQNLGVGWLEQPNDASVLWKDHIVGATDCEVMFIDATDPQILAATRGGEFIRFGRAEQHWREKRFPNPANVRFGKAIKFFPNGGIIMTSNTAADKKENKTRPGIWHRSHDGDWTVIDPTPAVKFDRMETIDLDGDGDLDVMTCEERQNLGVVWYENPSK